MGIASRRTERRRGVAAAAGWAVSRAKAGVALLRAIICRFSRQKQAPTPAPERTGKGPRRWGKTPLQIGPVEVRLRKNRAFAMVVAIARQVFRHRRRKERAEGLG